jgi:hypothetical protein
MIRTLAMSAAALFLAGASFAGAPGQKTKTAPKLIQLHVCPETGEAVKGEPAGSEVVGKYKVYFCCAGCKPAFDKLSKADKEKKVAELAKKSAPAKKG